MTVSKGTETYNHIKLAKIGEKAYEVRGVRVKDTLEKIFIYNVRDQANGINYEWRIAHGFTFDVKTDYEYVMDRSWKGKKIVDEMMKQDRFVTVREYGLTREVYRADLIAQNPDLVDTMTTTELLTALNEMAPIVGFTALDEWKKSKAALVGRIMESHGKLDGRKRRKAAVVAA